MIRSVPVFALGLSALLACAPEPATEEIALDASDRDLLLVRGYRATDDECRLTGETAFTNQFLGDASDLVACPRGSVDQESLLVQFPAAEAVADTETYRLYIVPVR